MSEPSLPPFRPERRRWVGHASRVNLSPLPLLLLLLILTGVSGIAGVHLLADEAILLGHARSGDGMVAGNDAREEPASVEAEVNVRLDDIERTRLLVDALILVLATGGVLAFILARRAGARGARLGAEETLRAVVAAAGQLAQGRLDTRVPIPVGSDEGAAATTFNMMAETLQNTLGTLEEQVALRTVQIETAAAVAGAASEVRNLATLLDGTVKLIVERFEKIYHAQVFLIESEANEAWAVLRASTGEVGRMLLARGHRLAVGSHSVIGQATATGMHVLARAFEPTTIHRPNDLLPNTQVELALPIVREGRLIGALDVQSTVPDAFGPDDIRILQTLADQLAIAVENTRLFEELSETIEEMEQLFRASSLIASAATREELFDAFSRIAARQPSVDRLSLILFSELQESRFPPAAQLRHRWERDSTEDAPGVDLDALRLTERLWSHLEEDRLYEFPDSAVFSENEPDLAGYFGSGGMKSFTAMSLVAHRQPLGLLLIESREAAVLPSSVVRLFRVLAQHASIALTRFSLLESSQRTAEQLSTVAEVSRAASTELNVQHLLDRAVTLVRDSFEDIYHAQVFLLDGEGTWAELRASTGEVGAALIARQHRLEVGSVSVIGYVTATGESLIARSSDVDPGSVHRHNELLPATRTELALPMKLGSNIIGALDVQSTDEAAFGNPEEVRVLQLLADQLAVATQNAHLFEESRERSSRLALSNRLGSRLLTVNTLDELVELAAEEISAIMDADEVRVSLAGSDGRENAIAARFSRPGTRYPGTATLAEVRERSVRWVATNRRPLAVSDVARSSLFEDLAGSLRGGPPGALLLLPLVARGRLLGDITLEMMDRPRQWSEQDLFIGQLAANLVAAAVEGTRLFEQVEQRAWREQQIAHITSRLHATRDPEEIVDVGLRELQRALDARRVSIWLSGAERAPRSTVSHPTTRGASTSPGDASKSTV